MRLNGETVKQPAKLASGCMLVSWSTRGLCLISRVGIEMGKHGSCARSDDNAGRFHGGCSVNTRS